MRGGKGKETAMKLSHGFSDRETQKGSDRMGVSLLHRVIILHRRIVLFVSIGPGLMLRTAVSRDRFSERFYVPVDYYSFFFFVFFFV